MCEASIKFVPEAALVKLRSIARTSSVDDLNALIALVRCTEEPSTKAFSTP